MYGRLETLKLSILDYKFDFSEFSDEEVESLLSNSTNPYVISMDKTGAFSVSISLNSQYASAEWRLDHSQGNWNPVSSQVDFIIEMTNSTSAILEIKVLSEDKQEWTM